MAFSSKPWQETQTYEAGCVWVFWSAIVYCKGHFGLLPGDLHWEWLSDKWWWEEETAMGWVIKFPLVWWAQGLMEYFSFFFFSPLGLQQQGIFRVPGSQVEVNDIKNSFERGRCRVGISSLWPEGSRVVLAHALEPVVCRAGSYRHLFPTLPSATSPW